MTQDDFERNIRSQYFPDLQRRACATVEATEGPSEVTFEHYGVHGAEFVLLRISKDDVRAFVPADLKGLRAFLPPAVGS